MAHFAKLDGNTVIQVIVVANDDTADEEGNESEATGIKFCSDLLGGTWIQTSYNDNFRRRFAGVGYTYDAERDAFIPPEPFPSWSLDDNDNWTPPTPHPNDGGDYNWNEATGQWEAVTDD